MPHPTPLSLGLCLALALPAAHAAPATCADAGGQLTEYLAGAKQRIGFDGEVQLQFEVGADGRARVRQLQGTRAYAAWVRSAVDALDCQAGTPQRYVLNIRFADPAPRAVAVAASATLARADHPPPPVTTPR